MRIWNTLRPIWLPFHSSQATLYASSACFYLLLSFAPALMLLFTLSDPRWLLPALELVPSALRPVLTALLRSLRENGTIMTRSLSGMVVLWSAARGSRSVMEGVYHVLHHQPSPLRRRVFGLILLLALLPVCLLLRFFQQGAPGLRLLFPALPLSICFSLLYWSGARRTIRYRWCLAGGLLGGGSWMLFSWLYSLYIQWFSGTVRIYGALGLLLLAVIWLRICVLLLLYGGVLAFLLQQGDYHPFLLLREAFFPRS